MIKGTENERGDGKRERGREKQHINKLTLTSCLMVKDQMPFPSFQN